MEGIITWSIFASWFFNQTLSIYIFYFIFLGQYRYCLPTLYVLFFIAFLINLNVYFYSAYTKANQADMMNKLLGTNNTLFGTSQTIIDTTGGSNYLARGHMAPDANFITKPEQVLALSSFKLKWLRSRF